MDYLLEKLFIEIEALLIVIILSPKLSVSLHPESRRIAYLQIKKDK